MGAVKAAFGPGNAPLVVSWRFFVLNSTGPILVLASPFSTHLMAVV